MNYITHVHAGIKRGYYLIQMDATAPGDWLLWVRRMITAVVTGVSPDSTSLPVIAACNDNARENLSVVVRVAMSVQR